MSPKPDLINIRQNSWVNALDSQSDETHQLFPVGDWDRTPNQEVLCLIANVHKTEGKNH